jgi:hypothetical protein
VIDPRPFFLFECGFFGPRDRGGSVATKLVVGAARRGATRAWRRVRGLPANEMGYAYHPAQLRELGAGAGYDVEDACSMYYEYRYHVILRPRGVTR